MAWNAIRKANCITRANCPTRAGKFRLTASAISLNLLSAFSSAFTQRFLLENTRMATAFSDLSRIPWQTLDGIAYLGYWILDIDKAGKIIDVLFKFDANRQIVLHRHKTVNKNLVIQGEHRLYCADGTVKDVRPVGNYTVSPASDEPHREGGSGEDAIVLFSIRGSDGLLYEILDDDLQVVGELGMADFVALYRKQREILS
jgi:hypothetical protein